MSFIAIESQNKLQSSADESDLTYDELCNDSKLFIYFFRIFYIHVREK